MLSEKIEEIENDIHRRSHYGPGAYKVIDKIKPLAQKQERLINEMLRMIWEIKEQFPPTHKIKLPLSFQIIEICDNILQKAKEYMGDQT